MRFKAQSMFIQNQANMETNDNKKKPGVGEWRCKVQVLNK